MKLSSEANFWGLRSENACLLLWLCLFPMTVNECQNIRFRKPQRSSDLYTLQLTSEKEPSYR
jgi:hypothetical protein